jgi:succinoglycan biosynthesis protein ExoM
MSSKTVICIATYKRPTQLQALLDSITEQVQSLGASVIVIDNDAHGSAREIAHRHPLGVLYDCEPTPGIAAARNRALDLLPPQTRWVIFVDDDEVVTAGWLAALEDSARRYDADAVTGPVQSIFETDPRPWITRGGFIQRPEFLDGAYRYLPATNNTIVNARWFLGDGGARFSEEFSLTGGSDAELFYRLKLQGARYYWCGSAVVTETVPSTRLTFRWIWRRGVRTGNVLARIQLGSRSRLLVFLGGIARLLFGILRAGVSVVRLRGWRYVDVIYIMRGIGFMQAVLGMRRLEYGRNQ